MKINENAKGDGDMKQLTRLVNAMIIDMTQEQPTYLGTIEMADGIITHIEKQTHICEVIENDTVLDVQGKYVIPGMIDTHSHIIMGSVQNPFPSCAGITSIAALIATMRQALPDTPLTPNGWLKIVGYEAEQFSEQRHPTRHDLDQISSDIPILLEHASSNTPRLGPNQFRHPNSVRTCVIPLGRVEHRCACPCRHRIDRCGSPASLLYTRCRR
ncbi:hypothetical protein CD122_01360 [Staphylococcus rostri]|uniref:Amidohydrolase 3 domain-containing protein n=1 Tax=Staphylococcus rostri TaxID=522262 RepID=A0A2K3YW70_9STAP|nr:hypothetical protein CD122_01360 [Staphylococcus rostri]